MTTLHILANPYGITDLRYRMEPFNIAVHKFITQMQMRGWTLIHYGHEASQVPCENVPLVLNRELQPRGDHDLFSHDPQVSACFITRATQQLPKRVAADDMVLCFYGVDHQPAVQGLQQVKIVEPSIGYRPSGIFAPYRVFTSSAMQHYYYGMQDMLLSPSWYDTVIPNAITPSEFEYLDRKSDYFLYLGRIMPDKGVNLAVQITEKIGARLVIAGTGTLADLGYVSIPKHVEVVGYADPVKRARLLRDAKALLAPTHYVEPFGNMVAESLMSGTPVITTDWGGFTDTNVHGITGYRCRDFRSFVQAAENIDKISTLTCRQWAESKFSDSVVHDQFSDYFHKLKRMDFYS